MNKRDFSIALYCQQHCSTMSCTDCYQLADDDRCPSQNCDFVNVMLRVSERMYERLKDYESNDCVEIDEIIGIFESELN